MFTRSQGGARRIGVAIGAEIVDLAVAAAAGLFDDALPDARGVLAAPSLAPLLACGRPGVRAVRERTRALLERGGHERLAQAGIAVDALLVPQATATMHLPCRIGDYVDFYSSVHHAENLGRILRPGEPALGPNYRYLPVGYHGRAGSIVCDGTAVRRPWGQLGTGAAPRYAPSEKLDYEVELGFLTAPGPPLGTPLSIAQARASIVGAVILNDWSARDIQAWEYRPLGPFLGKSFATSISPWLVTLDALEPYRVAGPPQAPEPPAYLHEDGARNYAITLDVALTSATMRARGDAREVVATVDARALYWSAAQQLAHLTSNGARVRGGDCFATGTISSAASGAVGSLIERTENGTRPLRLPDGSDRGFLDDGDEVTMRAWCGGTNGQPRIGFGSVRGTISPAL